MNVPDARFFRVVELVFTSYALPALLVPLVWLARRTLRVLHAGPSAAPATRMRRAAALYGFLSAAWLAIGMAFALGAPIERGGRLVGALLWLAYGLLNVALAAMLARFTASYGGLSEGQAKDRLFLYLLSAVVAQPLATACAFAVLYRVMGVVYHLQVPGLTGVQEGI